MNPIVEAVLLLLAVYAVLGLALWVLPASWERLRARQFERETDRIAGVAQRRWSVGEAVTGVAHWVAARVLRLDRSTTPPCPPRPTT